MRSNPLSQTNTERLRLVKSRRRRRAAFLFPLSLIVQDGLLAALSFWLAFRLRLLTEYTDIPPFSQYYRMMGIYVGTLLIVYFFYKLYQRRRSMSTLDEIGRVFAGTAVGTLMTLATTSFLYKNNLDFDYPRLMVLYAVGLTFVLVSAGRTVHGFLRQRLHKLGIATQLVLLVSGGEQAAQVVSAIRRSPASGYRLAGIVRAAGSTVPEELQSLVLGEENELEALVDRHGVDEVILALPQATPDHLLSIVDRVQREKVTIKVFPDVFQYMAGEMLIGELGGLPLLTVRDIALRGWKLAAKRIVDFVVSSVALVLLSPLMLLIALAIKMQGGGSVFFTQVRVGLDAKPFRLIKFRSMRPDAEKLGTWTTENDPRVTPIGRFIRRTSLDELPQLINVLIGEMSIVGPRPEQQRYVEAFRGEIPRYMDRHREKAGITGWAQVNGLRGDTSIQERTQYDLWYTEHWSLSLDFKIMIRTAIAMVADRNAY